MKRVLYTLAFLLAMAASDVMAQRGLPGMNSVEFGMDMVDGVHAGKHRNSTGYAFRLTAQTYAKRGNKWTYGVEMLKRNYPYRDSRIPFWQYTAEAGYAYNFYSSPEKLVFLNIGISGMLGYETVNQGERLLWDGASLPDAESFIYGGAVSLEAETYLTDRLVLVLRLRERILWGSAASLFHTGFGVGIRYIL